jgi:hypothetical protein
MNLSSIDFNTFMTTKTPANVQVVMLRGCGASWLERSNRPTDTNPTSAGGLAVRFFNRLDKQGHQVRNHRHRMATL